jgi:hypothetical protein
MGTVQQAKSEYNYYTNFVKNTKTKISSSPAVNFLQLHCLLLELMEVLVTKKHDLDDIRFRCCEIMATTFNVVSDIPQLRACFPSNKHHTKWILERDQSPRLPDLLKASRELLVAYINIALNTWDSTTLSTLQEKLDEFTFILWDISNTPDIHNMLSLSIQITSHYHILQERQQTMAYKPFMQKSFESKSIYPWRYTWNRYSMEFLEYLNQCGKVVLGKEYAMYELLEIIREIIEHKRNDHHMSNEIIALEFSFFLNVPIEEINVSDTRTFIYPILFHLLSKSFEELWMDKHKLAWRTPYDLKRSHAQILNSIKYPPCTLREQDNTSYVEVPSPVYSELSINEENNEQNTDLPTKTMRTETDPEIEPEKEKPATIEISSMDDKDKTIDIPAIDDVD